MKSKETYAVIRFLVITLFLSMALAGCGQKPVDPLEKELDLTDEMQQIGDQENDSTIDKSANSKEEVKKENKDETKESKGENAIEEDESQVKEEEKATEKEEPIDIDYKVVQPNEVGHIMVIMYHGILDNYPYHVTEEQFLEDLRYMYDHGYRPISMRDYLDNTISVAPGMTPIVLTFDDGLSSTFSLVEDDGQLVPAKGTAVEIMERFYREHPDFGKAATFYINGGKIFQGAGTVEQRLQWLVENGYDVANHTSTHKKLSMKDVTSKVIMTQLGTVDQIIKSAIVDYTVDSMTYPFGARPREALRAFIREGEYQGEGYFYQAAFREGPSRPYYAPIHVKFDPYNIARARGSKGENGDMWSYFDYYEKNPARRYISDGRPDRVAVTKKMEQYVDKDRLQEASLYIYDLEEEASEEDSN